MVKTTAHLELMCILIQGLSQIVFLEDLFFVSGIIREQVCESLVLCESEQVLMTSKSNRWHKGAGFLLEN
jgi:hypothetical protein